jgi:hypothetical protein
MSIVADRGLKKSQYTSARLKKGDVLYVETHRHRYAFVCSLNSMAYPQKSLGTLFGTQIGFFFQGDV